MTATLPVVMNIGGQSATWVWGTRDDVHGEAVPRTGTIPAGLLVDHGDHLLLVPWAEVGGMRPEVTLESLQPLTLGGVVRCPTCGKVGRVERGAWLPEAGAVRG